MHYSRRTMLIVLSALTAFAVGGCEFLSPNTGKKSASGGGTLSAKADVVLGSLDHLTITDPVVTPTCVSFSVVARAYDQNNNFLSSYNGAATWTDLSGTLTPATPTTFVNGYSTTTAQVTGAGANTITLTTGAKSVTSNSFSVTQAFNNIVVTTTGPYTTCGNFTVNAQATDGCGNLVTTYNAAGTWTSDLAGLTPATPGNFVNGYSTTTAQLTGVGTGTVTVTSGTNLGTSGSFVMGQTLNSLAMTAIADPQTSCTNFNVYTQAKDTCGNLHQTYAGAATWTDLSGTIAGGPPQAFVNGYSTTATANIPGLYTADTITVTSGTKLVTSNTFNVTASGGTATQITISAIGAQTACTNFTVNAQAKDACGNVVTGYSGASAWSDTSGTLTGAAPSFVNGYATMATAQVPQPYASDLVYMTSGALTQGASAAFNVTGYNTTLAAVTVANPGAQTSCTNFTVTAQAKDACNNFIANYSAAATWTDLSGTLTPATPGNFVNGYSTTNTAQVPSPYAGDTVSITTAAIMGTSGAFTVTGYSATLDHLTSNTPAAQTTCSDFTINAVAYDACNNVIANYVGAATWTDLTGTVTPTPTTFVNGYSTTTAQVTGVHAADTITLTSGTKLVTTGTFAVTQTLSSITATTQGPYNTCTNFTVQAQARDACGNLFAGYNTSGTATWTNALGGFSPGLPGDFVNGYSTTTTAQVTQPGVAKYAYAANYNGPSITSYTVNAATGALTALGSTATGTGPQQVTVDPSNRYLYTANFTVSTVSAFSINAATGALTSIAAYGTGTNPYYLAIDPFGRFLYTANGTGNNVSMFTINQATGALTSIGVATAGTGPRAIAIEPTGRFAYVANAGSTTLTVHSINQTTGALTATGGSASPGAGLSGVTVHPTGRFLYTSNTAASTVSMYSIDGTTGALTSIAADVAAGLNPVYVGVDPSGRFAYTANNSAATSTMYSINAGTGALTSLGGVATGAGPYMVNFDPTGRFAYVANENDGTVSAYTIDQITGVLTVQGAAVAAGAFTDSVALTASSTGNTDSITIASGGKTGQTATYTVGQALTTLDMTAIGAQSVCASFSVYSQAKDACNALMTTYSGAATWTDLSGTITPATPSAFVNGYSTTATTQVTAQGADTITLTSDTKSVTSGSFNVTQTLAGITATTSTTAQYSTCTDFTVNAQARDACGAIYTGYNSAATWTNALTGLTPATPGNFVNGYSTSTAQLTKAGVAKYAYTANWTANTVSGYSIDPLTGALTSLGAAVATGSAPGGVTVDPTGRFVYVANLGTNNVSMYTINPATGVLTSIGTVGAGAQPYHVAVDPTGRFAYAVNFGHSSLSMYTINQTTGALTSIGTAAVNGVYPVYADIDPTGRFIYTANSNTSNISMFSINQTTGELTSIGAAVASGAYTNSVTVDPTGRFVYAANYSAGTATTYSINQTTGALTDLGAPVAPGGEPYSVTVDPTGRFAYVASSSGARVTTYTVNQSTGALTYVGFVSTGATSFMIRVDATGRFAYVSNYGNATVVAYSINQGTGALTAIGAPVAAGTNPFGLATTTAGLKTDSLTIASGGKTGQTATYVANTTLALSLTNFLGGGAYRGGAAQNLTWTVSDACALGATPIAVDYSSNSGGAWTAVTAGVSAVSPYSWSLPTIDSSTARVRLTATDSAGNTATAASTADFLIDSTSPVLSSIVLTPQSFELSSTWAPRWSSLASNWKMDNDWNDAKGANNGTGNGGIGFSAAPKIGTHAGSFDGTDDNVSLGDPVSLRFTTAFTLSAWIKPTVTTAGAIFARWTAAAAEKGILLDLTGTSKVRLKTQTDGAGDADVVATSTTSVTSASWWHVAATYDGTNIKLYVNGALEATTAQSGTLDRSGGESLNIGSQPDGGPYFTGLIDDAAAWPVALNAQEIQTIYARQNAALPTPTNKHVTVSIAATDNLSNITDFCFKYVNSPPGATSACWKTVAGDAGLGLSQNLNLNNWTYDLADWDGTQTVYVWTRDAVGNVSALGAAGAGTEDVDKDTTTLTFACPYSLPATVTVANTYAGAPNWNDYVLRDLPNDKYWNQTGTACTGDGVTETHFNQCLHAGALKKVVVTGVNSCYGLSVTDSLATYKWVCDDTSGTATFYSLDFQKGKGLRNLVDASSWKSNEVTVTCGASNTASTGTTWYANTVAPLPDNSGAGAAHILLDGTDEDGAGPDQVYAAGTVFTLASSRASNGYNIGPAMARSALVTLPGALLSFTAQDVAPADGLPDAMNCSGNNGSTTTPAPCGGCDYTALVAFQSNRFIWIEGDFKGDDGTLSANAVILSRSGTFTRVHNSSVSVKGAASDGAYWIQSGIVTVTDSYLQGGASALVIGGGSYPALIKDTVVANSNTGIFDWGPNVGTYGSIIVNNVTASNCANGFYVRSGNGHAYTQVTALGGFDGIVTNGSKATFAFATLANNAYGLHFYSNDTLSYQVGAVNNYYSLITNSSNHTVRDSFFYSVPTYEDIYLYSSADNNKFLDNVLVRGGCTNTASGGTNNIPAGTNIACAKNDASPAFGAAANPAASYVGPIATTDTVNGSAVAGDGTKLFTAITDWTHFENLWRGFGKHDPAAHYATAHLGACATGGTCHVWDFSLSPADTILKNKSGNGTTANGAWENLENCPAEIHGNNTVTDVQPTPVTFLKSAVEVMSDGIGNDNGLCESNEACIYAPHFASSYQGTGDYTQQRCVFQNGTITGVTMYAYPINGAF